MVHSTGDFFQCMCVSVFSVSAEQTAVHDVEGVVSLVGNAGVVSGHDQGAAALGAELKEKVQDFSSGFGIEVAGGFIGNQQRGMIDEGARNGDPLLFTAGKLRGTMFYSFFQPDPAEQLFGFADRFTVGTARDPGRHGDVFQSVKFGQKVIGLENETDLTITDLSQFAVGKLICAFAVEDDIALIGCIQSGQQIQQGGFAGTGRAAQGNELARPHVHGNAAQDLQFAFADKKGFMESLSLEDEFFCMGFRLGKFVVIHGAKR